MRRRSQTYPEKLVQRVNELYHDATGERYDHYHPEILDQESDRWGRLAARYLHMDRPITVLDIGTGTGFVPLTVAKTLKAADALICSDISAGILEAARLNLAKEALPCQVSFTKLEAQAPFRLPFDTGSIDVITINSVLHHIAETGQFLSEIDRVLSAGGLLMIGHEPNKRFFENRVLWWSYAVLNVLVQPKLTVLAIARKLHTENLVWKVYYAFRPGKKAAADDYAAMMDRINAVLQHEGLTGAPLPVHEIEEIVDVHAWEGFKAEELLPEFSLLEYETYNHLFWVTMRLQKNRFINRCDAFLRRRYPTSGSTFFAVLQKPQQKMAQQTCRRQCNTSRSAPGDDSRRQW